MATLPTNYQKHMSADPSRKFFLRRFNKTLVKNIKNLNVSSILDAGCGEGFTLNQLYEAKAAKHLEGVDFSKQAVSLGNKQFPKLKLKQGDIYKLPYKKDEFELVICSEVLEHLEHPEKAVREVLRVSKKYVLFSVPNEPFFMGSRLLKGMNIKQLGNHPEHINHWNVFSFPQMLQKNGVKVKKVLYPFPWILVLGKKE
ncbi:MAG: class I SAM-dependent methyltransferase [Candidatus Levyibacteriota bacterium]